ncbi:MAG: LPS assembly lipoprotein LptE [Pseudomonadota bacterium]
MARRRFASGIALLATLGLLGGCGFQLRSYALDESAGRLLVASQLDPARIDAPAESMADVLRSAFESAGAELVDNAEDADLILEILDERSGRRSVSVTGNARTAEYEVSRSVNYRLARAGEELISPTWLRVQRVLRLDLNNVVGSNAEQALLERELRSDLVQQIVRSVNQTLRRQS